QKKYLQLIEEVLKEALQSLIAMKQKEGDALRNDIEMRLTSLEKSMGCITLRAQGATERYREKLTKRLQEFLSSPEEIDPILMRELFIFAEKVDISEEITRIQSHVAQFKDWLKSKQASVGK